LGGAGVAIVVVVIAFEFGLEFETDDIVRGHVQKALLQSGIDHIIRWTYHITQHSHFGEIIPEGAEGLNVGHETGFLIGISFALVISTV